MQSSQSIIEILSQHILKIYDKEDNEIIFSKLEIKEEKRKFSITCSKVVYLDDIPLKSYQQKTYKVLYKCRCGRENKIYLCKYLGKDKIICQHCLQDRKFDDHLETKPYSVKNNLRTRINNRIPKNIDDFNIMSDEFKKHFYEINLSENEFYAALPNIYSINGILISNIDITNVQYKIFKTNNQYKFGYKISFDNGKTFNKIHNVCLKCSICGKIHNVHLNNIRNKDMNNIKCSMCGYVNHRYEIRLYDDSGLTYQSNVEKYFIDKCYENNIKIVNGFKIPYIINNKHRTYITDFYLPDYKYIIEIKSNNIWYKRDLKNGIIDAKINAAKNFNKDFQYKMLFDNDIDDFITFLMKDIVLNSEMNSVR